MSNLKFRAYVKHLQIIIEVQRINFDYKTVEWYIVHPDEWDMSEFSFDEVELMQYTWLKDKNGKIIYESDIVEVNTFEHWNIRMYVIYDAPLFLLSPNIWEKINVMNFSTPNVHETVIWNIYENPELLWNQSN